MTEPNSLNLPSVSPLSRRERVAEILREAITTGELTPGQRLTEIGLAEQLGTSRAPVREALRQLEQEGLVASYPYKGTEVLGVSQEEIEQVLVPIRLTLERFAFGKAVAHLTEDALAELNRLVEAIAAAADSPARLADADVKFHEAVIKLSGQTHCLQIWKSIQPRVRSYFRRDASYYEDPHEVADQHRELVDALRSRDLETIDQAITAHIQTHFSQRDPS